MLLSLFYLEKKASKRAPAGSRPTLYVSAACSFFVLAGLAFVPRLGLQNDEALFAWPLFEPRGGLYTVSIGRHRLVLMLLTYLGTLKTAIYKFLFQWFGTSIWTIRVPMLLAGAASVWLFYLFLRRAAGERAALIGSALLAVDPIYLLTSGFDWGPVALQHLLLIAGLLLAMRFWQTREAWSLAGAFFLFGLATWDKALAIWTLSALGISGLLLFPRQILSVIRSRYFALVFPAFALGALPLIVYNLDSGLSTYHSTVSWDKASEVEKKAHILRITAEGSVLFDWMVSEDWQTPHPHQPHGAIAQVSAAFASLTGHPRRTLTIYGFCAALLLAAFSARGAALRGVLFALLVMAITWVQMAITVNAGGSAHHSILLWPFPQMAMGISFAAAWRGLGRVGPPLAGGLVAVLLASNLAVVNQYYVRAARDGGAINWTDAIFPLATYLKGIPASEVFCADWGILDGLRLLDRGRLPLRVGTDPLSNPKLRPEDRQIVQSWLSGANPVFVTHTARFEFFQGTSARLLAVAEELGYRRDILATVPDSFGRPTFEVYRFRKSP